MPIFIQVGPEVGDRCRDVLAEASKVLFVATLGSRDDHAVLAGQLIDERSTSRSTLNDGDRPLNWPEPGLEFSGRDIGPARVNVGGALTDTALHSGQLTDTVPFIPDALNVNLPAQGIGGAAAGVFSFLLFNQRGTRFLNLELSALQADGRGKIISSPRVITADQVEAIIEQGTEIPYQQATSSGATAIQFKKATLSLRVKPQITPDDNLIMTLNVHKDSVGQQTVSGPSIDTKQVATEVLVENGGTVVIGGIYIQDERSTVNKVPLLGDIPYVGFLFKNTIKFDNRAELLIFVTPRILKETLRINP